MQVFQITALLQYRCKFYLSNKTGSTWDVAGSEMEYVAGGTVGAQDLRYGSQKFNYPSSYNTVNPVFAKKPPNGRYCNPNGIGQLCNHPMIHEEDSISRENIQRAGFMHLRNSPQQMYSSSPVQGKYLSRKTGNLIYPNCSMTTPARSLQQVFQRSAQSNYGVAPHYQAGASVPLSPKCKYGGIYQYHVPE